MAFKNINQNFLVEAILLNDTDGSSIELSDTIVNIMVRKRFIVETFPLYVIDLKTTEDVRDIIRDNECKINLRISSYESTTNAQINEFDTEVVAESEVIFNGNIRIYDKPFSVSTTKIEEENIDAENESSSIPYVYYRISGIPEDLIIKNENIVNGVYYDATINDVLVYNLTYSGLNNVHIQSADNIDIYDNIIVPPVTLSSSIDFLNDNYSIYNRGMSFFIDSTGVYLYSPFSDSKDTLNLINIVIPDVNSTNITSETVLPEYDEDTGDFRYTIKKLPNFAINEKIVAENTGTNTTFYSYDDVFNILQRNMSSEDENNFNKVRYFWNGQRRKEFEDAFYSLGNKSISTNIAIANINPNKITPLTEFNFETKYSAINGRYITSAVSYSFSSNDKKHFDCLMSVDLIKK